MIECSLCDDICCETTEYIENNRETGEDIFRSVCPSCIPVALTYVASGLWRCFE